VGTPGAYQRQLTEPAPWGAGPGGAPQARPGGRGTGPPKGWVHRGQGQGQGQGEGERGVAPEAELRRCSTGTGRYAQGGFWVAGGQRF